MDKDKSIKIIGFACAIVGFGVTMINKQLDDKKLNNLVENEVRKQLDKK